MPSLIETLRKQSVDQLFTIPSFSSGWTSGWRTQIKTQLGSQLSATNILNLGDQLSSIFLSRRTIASRSGTNSQAGASSAGAAWEALICWYLNLCSIGTRIVAFKLRSMVPSAFKDALTINYGTTITNSESDLIVIVFPDHPDFTTDITTNTSLYIRNRIIPSRVLSLFDRLSSTHFTDFSLGVVQCKTNWNEIAQIPMLWDLVYNSTGFISRSQISLGKNSFQLTNLKLFTYSFVTVPTNELSNFTPHIMPVKRVANLSGSNYWGHPTRNSVAFSIKEIFTKNFSSGFTNLRTRLASQILHISTVYNYFKL